MEDTNEPKLEEYLMSAAEERTPLNFIEDTAIDYANYTEFDSSKEVKPKMVSIWLGGGAVESCV